MKRKLIKHGESSLTISLPRSFVKTNNLQKGQEIDVQELDDGLFVSTKNQKEKTTISIDISNQKPVIKKILGAIYKTGYDEINIHFSSFEELRKIKEIVQRQFEGYKIMHQGKNNLLIKKLSADNFEEFNNVLRRFFLIMNNMGLEMTEAIKKTDYDWLKRISLLKIEVDGLADYCRRAINLKFNSDYKRMSPLYVIIEEMEKVSDNYKRLCLHIGINELKIKKANQELIGKIVDFQNLFYHLFFKFDLSKINDFIQNKEEIQQELNKLIRKSTEKEFKVFLILDRILNIISDLNGPLMAVHI